MLKELVKTQQGQDSNPGWEMQSLDCFLSVSLPSGYLGFCHSVVEPAECGTFSLLG